jgi:hypothetical protein
MGASFGYANARVQIARLDMSWLPLSRFESRAAGVAAVAVGVKQGEANGGGDGMAVEPMGVGSDRG